MTIHIDESVEQPVEELFGPSLKHDGKRIWSGTPKPLNDFIGEWGEVVDMDGDEK